MQGGSNSTRGVSARGSISTRLRLPGKFIALEGPDGGGKSTQAKLLARALSEKGKKCLLTREPGGTPLGENVRTLLLEDGPNKIGTRAELFLFMAARSQVVEDVIFPALEMGNVVISERFLMSSVVYQGVAGDIPAGEVEVIGHSATMGVMPDLTIVIDVDTKEGANRRSSDDRIEKRGAGYLEKVRQGFLSLAARERGSIFVVDGNRSIEEVHADIMKIVNDVAI